MRADASAGVVLGVESVPDGLASGVLAGVNPLAGLYGSLFGMVGAALFTSSTFMAVQATGAMALVVSDAGLAGREDPTRALFTLTVLTGIVMLAVGLLGGGTLLRFVPTAVMTGFVTAVGVNIVLGQLSNLTGYDAPGANRVARALDLLLHPWRVDGPTLLIGVVTGVLIVTLIRTRLGPLGMVVAVVVGSALAVLADEVAVVGDLAELPSALPLPQLPDPGEVLFLALPALSLAFVGLVQGAAVSAGVPNPDGGRADASRDFVGQGAGNIAAGVFQGMPVGGSMSASALVSAGGARSRGSLLIAGVTMALVIMLLADLVGRVAMPALAALLITVGAGAVKPDRVMSVVRTTPLQTSVMVVTFALTLIIPLQYAVLTGVGLAIVLHVAQQSNELTVRRVEVTDDGRVRETDVPPSVPAHHVVVLQPYGSLFFASAPYFREQLPEVVPETRHSVVIVRMRGVDQLGLSFIDVLRTYARQLRSVDSELWLVLSSERVRRQVLGDGTDDVIDDRHIYLGTSWLGATLREAHDDAWAQVRRKEGES